MQTSPVRALGPAAVTAVLSTLVAVLTTGAYELVQRREGNPPLPESGVVDHLVLAGLRPFGETGVINSHAADASMSGFMLGLGVMVLVVLVVVWMVAASLAPGSWSLPVWIAGWFAVALGGVVGGIAASLIRARQVTEQVGWDALAPWHAKAAQDGGHWGLFVGFFLGLAAMVVWMLRRPRPAAAPVEGPAAPPEPDALWSGEDSGDSPADPGR